MEEWMIEIFDRVWRQATQREQVNIYFASQFASIALLRIITGEVVSAGGSFFRWTDRIISTAKIEGY